MNRTIQERVRCMISNPGLPQSFWGEAVKTAIHLNNRSLSKVLDGGVPEEAWTGKPPSYAHLRVFGYEAYVYVPKEQRNKLDPKSRKCIFVGYGDSGKMGYRLWNPESHKLVRSNDVVFSESTMYKPPVKTVEIWRVIFEEDGHVYRPARNDGDHGQNGEQEQPQEGGNAGNDEPVVYRRSTRVSRPPDRYVPTMDYVMLKDCDGPSTYQEAMKRDDHVKWEKAMKSEMDSLHNNDTWDLVPLPKGKNALPCKWVFKLKNVPDDDRPKYKARLVAKAKEDMELVQMDVKTVFLHGDLHEDIYMEQPIGFAKPGKEYLVCKLKKSLYGLKQASREWYRKFDTFMKSQAYMRSETDHCLYTKRMADGSLLILVLYVDDMLIAGKDKHNVDALKSKLSETFAMKDLGNASHILGMRINQFSLD
ncbi:hypothetical protein L7F22_054766 [Adiantum nelumboides]|nr:hypothetical protein [Adiantum nelumboides]